MPALRLALGGIDRSGTAAIELGPEPISVERFVTQQGAKGDTLDQRLHTDGVGRWPGSKTKRTKLPSASTRATILVGKPPRERPMA